jgi:pyruvate carboxylase
VLEELQIQGPTNNINYLKAIVESPTFQKGDAMTTFLNTFEYTPRYVILSHIKVQPIRIPIVR